MHSLLISATFPTELQLIIFRYAGSNRSIFPSKMSQVSKHHNALAYNELRSLFVKTTKISETMKDHYPYLIYLYALPVERLRTDKLTKIFTRSPHMLEAALDVNDLTKTEYFSRVHIEKLVQYLLTFENVMLANPEIVDILLKRGTI